MSDLRNLFDEETVENISNLVENQMPLLNQISAFKEKDRTLANQVEDFENSLSKDLNDKFDDIMKLQYQIDSYYFTLAYILGSKHGKKFGEI